MATLKAIRRRIASVTSTQQITRAMQLVAAARLRRAREALVAARPYHQALTRVADALLGAERATVAPAEGAKRRALVLAVASDRGLCGAYNANLLRIADQEARRAAGEGMEVALFAVGVKALDHFRRERQPLAGQRVNNQPRLATFGLARDLAARVLGDWRTGEVSEAALVYTQFRSVLSQQPVAQRILPLGEAKGAGQERAEATAPDYIIEPSRAELVPVVLKGYVEATIFHALLEAEASELGARMTAMDSATNNAGEMIERLTLDMNHARQASITKELMDIVGGVEALRG